MVTKRDHLSPVERRLDASSCRCVSRPIIARISSARLQWLSRRWIYNIPRSSQTQSFRPLGRLALIDHVDRVSDRVRAAISAATDKEGLAASSRVTGLPFQPSFPRVFIVSSISGGTGSGMAIDVAYLVRNVLRDLGLSEEGICGILAHCAGRSPQGRDLAVANATAFSRPNCTILATCNTATRATRPNKLPGVRAR